MDGSSGGAPDQESDGAANSLDGENHDSTGSGGGTGSGGNSVGGSGSAGSGAGGSDSADSGTSDAAPSDGPGNEAGSTCGSLDAGCDAGSATFFRIMPVGDSITAGYTDNPAFTVPFTFGYRGPLYALLEASFPGRFTFVGASPEPLPSGNLLNPATPRPSPDLVALDQDHHRGYGGFNTVSISSNIAPWLGADDPDIVLLMIGINDIGVDTTAEPVSAENGLQAIVETIVAQKPDAEVLVAQITPYSRATPALVAYNTWIRTVLVPGFQGRGKKVGTVDQFAALLDSNSAIDPGLFANGINHPNQVAYARMAKIWFDGLVPIFNR